MLRAHRADGRRRFQVRPPRLGCDHRLGRRWRSVESRSLRAGPEGVHARFSSVTASRYVWQTMGWPESNPASSWRRSGVMPNSGRLGIPWATISGPSERRTSTSKAPESNCLTMTVDPAGAIDRRKSSSSSTAGGSSVRRTLRAYARPACLKRLRGPGLRSVLWGSRRGAGAEPASEEVGESIGCDALGSAATLVFDELVEVADDHPVVRGHEVSQVVLA